MKYLLVLALIVVGTAGATYFQPEKKYPVVHTKDEWIQSLRGINQIREGIRNSGMAAKDAFYYDSILNIQSSDINYQVSAAIKADTIQVKSKK